MNEIIDLINDSKSIIIMTHEKPDGDAIGSALAMNQALINEGKNVDLIIPKIPKTFEKLPLLLDLKQFLDRCYTYA